MPASASPIGDPVPYGTAPYGTPPPFAPDVFIDGAKAPERVVTVHEDLLVDQQRADRSLAGATWAIDPTDLGDIIVLSSGRTYDFAAPVKAVKALDGDLVILATLRVESEIVEWPIATFREWSGVYREDYTA